MSHCYSIFLAEGIARLASVSTLRLAKILIRNDSESASAKSSVTSWPKWSCGGCGSTEKCKQSLHKALKLQVANLGWLAFKLHLKIAY